MLNPSVWSHEANERETAAGGGIITPWEERTTGKIRIVRKRACARKFSAADEIREQLVRAVGPGGDLPPQPKTDVNPVALSDLGAHKRALLPSLVVLERLVHLDQIRVPLIVGNNEVVPRSCTHFDHAAPISFGKWNTGSSDARISTFPFSSVTRVALNAAGNGAYESSCRGCTER